MKAFNGVAMTDELNLKGHIFPVKAIYNAYFNSPPYPTPSFANHDHTKLIGYTELLGIYCQPGRAFLLNKIYFPESKDDYDSFPNAHDYLYKKRYIDRKQKYDELRALLGSSLTEEALPCYVNAVSFSDKDIVKKVLPELGSVDKDGLFDLNKLTEVMPGVYAKGSFLVFAHQYFRRGFSHLNTLNQEFLNLLHKVGSENQCSVKVALDYNLIGMVGTEQEEFEYSYWWGPKFSDSVKDIPYGVTRHNNDKYDSVFSDIRWTEFGFYEQDNKQTFECEEITDSENLTIQGNHYSGCRFVHSMFNNLTDIPEHLDGAVRAYSMDKMCLRLDLSIDKCTRDTEYTKLWRIDGEIDIVRWKELITHYFRDNMLVGEYFNGKDEKLIEYSNVPDLPQTPTVDIADFIPTHFSEGDGLRFAVKRIPVKTKSDTYQIYVRSNAYIRLGDKVDRFFEAETITLIKLLRRKGFSVRPPSMKCIEFGDTITNMPVFECNSLTSANSVLDSFLDLCSKWCENGDNRLTSITIKINHGDWFTSFSFAGHVIDFLKIFDDVNVEFPEIDSVSDWIDKINNCNNRLFGKKCNPTPFGLFHDNGVLAFKRQFVKKEYVDKLLSDKLGMEVNLALPLKQANIIKSSELKVAPVFAIKNEICSRCNTNYETCGCVKFIDDVSVELRDADYIGLIWTNRHAWDGIEPLRMKL